MPNYTTTQGDTWDIISLKVYGDEAYMNLLIDANPSHNKTVIFGSNITIIVPDLPEETNVNLPPWRQ